MSKKLNELLPEGIKVQIVNPQGILLLGRSKQFDEEQQKDFELIKRQYSYQKSRKWAKKPNIDDFIKQENYKRKHKFSTWLKSCMQKPFPTWSDDPGEIVIIVCFLIMGWMTRIYAFGADSEWGIRIIFMFGCIFGFCGSIPSAIKAFYFKNGSEFGVFTFFAELIMLIGSIICLCLY